MKICKSLKKVEQNGKVFYLYTDAVEIRIMFLTDDIIRIRAGFDGEEFEEGSYSLVMTAWEDRMDSLLEGERRRVEPAEAVLTEEMSRCKEAEDRFVIRGEKLTLYAYKEPFRLQIVDRDGTVLHEDIPYRGWQHDSNNRRIHTSLLEGEDHFYGFGERTGELDKREQFLITSPGDAMGYNPKETDGLYKHIPFYIKLNEKTKKASGYFYHSTWECDFNMGRTHSNYTRHFTTARFDGGDVDLFFIGGPSMKSVVERYTDLTGKSLMLPKAALGYLGSSMYYPELPKNADDAILGFVEKSKREKVPMDGFQLSSGYCEIDAGEGMKRYVFTWNKDKFKDPAQFFAEMKKQGITVSPNVKPAMLLSHPFKKQMEEKGMFIKEKDSENPATGLWWGGMGHYVDFTKDSIRHEWKKLLKEHLISYGATSIWNDNCEYEGLLDKDARVYLEGKGGTVGEVRPVMSNLMCLLSQEAVHEEEPNTRAFVVCRSGHAGIQRYAQTWAGDNLTCWEALKYNIATILGMGLSGVANHGCDIGGFYGTAPSEELFVRWVQNGIFQPRFSIHSTNTDNTVTEPWMYHNTKDLIKAAIDFRYALSPYLYSLMYKATETGLPIMQPLVLAFQEDTACYKEGVNFMFGDALLVANVVEEGAKEKEVYLPKGCKYYNFYTREEYEGGESITVPVTLESIPLFLTSGAILPMAGNPLQNLTQDAVKDLKIICVPDKDNSFLLYEDDGCSMAYKEGCYCKTKIHMKAGEQTSISFQKEGSFKSSIETMYLDAVHRQKAPYWVNVAGKKIPQFLHRDAFEEAKEGWYYSQTLKSVQIKYPNPEGDYEVIISFETFDLIGM